MGFTVSFNNKEHLRKISRGIIFPLLILAAWWGLARWELVPPMFLPTPGKVVTAFISLWKEGVLAFNLKVSFIRFFAGTFLGITAGFLLGMLFGMFRTLEKLVAPLFNAIRQVPLLAWIPLIIIFCGIAEASKIFFIALGCSFPIVLSTFDGIRGVRKEYVEVGRVFGFGRIRLIRKIFLPSVLPSLVTGLRMSLNIGWGQLVAAELFMFTQAGGIGNMIGQGRINWRMDIVMVGIIIIGFIGFALDYVAKTFENRFMQWRNS
ncbi:ABC transporter permease [Geotalea uraniireducens]|uniref:Binding-protein-dependent transport systems inner membrane component n=1 Tax=Geotalea uraniireducens (strain Rf4) TaxID=351605 RepID=A5G8B4_GEOUR|nr:ABC transporter permease [Geotalea uraniireducens]ABQ28032.1 binding-protein-dependent transport systems inner membrane component [Geotalea uraniireducens Rf4]